jgi:hypothetical protein
MILRAVAPSGLSFTGADKRRDEQSEVNASMRRTVTFAGS